MKKTIVLCLSLVWATCPFPRLPDSLSKLVPAFETTGSANTFGRFLLPNNSTHWTFTLTQEALVRLAVDPVNVNIAASIRVKAKVLNSKEISVDGSEVLTCRLQVGRYEVVMEFQAELKEDEEEGASSIDCDFPNAYLSFAITPLTQVAKLSKADLAAKRAGFPVLDFDAALRNFTRFELFDTSRYLDLVTITTVPSELAVYALELREPTGEQRTLGHSNLWTLSFSVYQDFGEWAGFTLLLSQERVEVSKSLQCVNSGNCILSHRTQKNSVTLYSTLSPGNYTLLALHTGMSSDEQTALEQYQGRYIPFSVNFYLEPLPEREAPLICEAGRLPVSLNAAGLLDSTGFLSYHDNVYVETYSRQQTHFTLTQPSVLRLVTIEPAGVGVDLQILGSAGDIVALSETIDATEGILVELDQGEYILQLLQEQTRIANPRLLLCDTIRVELDVIPQQAAQAYAVLYELQQCSDDSEAVTALLDQHFLQLKQSEAGFVLNPNPETSYRLPLHSISKGDEVLLQYRFTLPVDCFLYFEVLSNSVLADLTFLLTNSGHDEWGNALSLERYSRRTFHGQVNSGSYSIMLKTGPGARDQGNSQPFDSNFKTLYKCAVFQLKIEVMPISDTKFTQMICAGVNFVLAPNTLNTVDKLGPKGANQLIFPEAGFFAEHILAPDNRKSTEAKNLSIMVNEISILRANFASHQGGMIVVLQTEVGEIARVGTKAQSTDSVILTAVLQGSVAYNLSLYFYPSHSDCPVYDLNIEVRTNRTVGIHHSCDEVLPTSADLVHYQTVEDSQFITFSASSRQVSEYTYYRGEERVQFAVPFDIHTPSAVVKAHLQADFAESGLTFSIESAESTVATGFFVSRHRAATRSLILPKGKYSLVIEETGRGLAGGCSSFSAAVYVVAQDLWTPSEELVRSKEKCELTVLPETLNSAGELSWHREFPLNGLYPTHRVTFTLQEVSILHLALDPLPDVRVYGRVFKGNEQLLSRDAAEGIHMRLEPGIYRLELVNTPQTGMPLLMECIAVWVDFQVVPQSKYLKLAEANSCSVSSALPGALKQPGVLQFQVFTEAVFDVKVKVELAEDSEVLWELSYVGALTGAMGLTLHTWQGLEVAQSVSVQDFATLTAAVPAGLYFLHIYNTLKGAELAVCATISLVYSTQPASSVCVASPLPTELFSEQSKPFGGPQAKDGSLRFDGMFKVPSIRSSQPLLLRIGEPCFARFLFLSSTAMELTLYEDSQLTTPIGYSQTAGRTGNFATELPARFEPYTLSLTFLQPTQTDACPTFQLAIEIQPLSAVKQKLACDTSSNTKSLLPELRILLSGKETKGGLNYVIRSNSKETRKEEFVHQIEVEIRTPGRFSAFTSFDFLTTDISLQLMRDSQVLGKSNLSVLGSQLSSSVEDLQLEAGRYTLRLHQPSPTHLALALKETDLCFSFAFSVELDAKTGNLKPENMLNVNKLISVIPNDKSDINPLEALFVTITWEEAVYKGKKGSFVRAFYLQNAKKGKVHPSSIRQDKWSPQRLELTFKAGLLWQGSCFSLHMNVKDFDLQEDDPLPEMDFVGAHQYCTSSCACNPKAKARCSQDQECICAEPYQGLTCEECMTGYIFDSETGICVSEECEDCTGFCIQGKCVTRVPCECGEYGSCLQGKCRCKEGYAGDQCSFCADGKLLFPLCFSCKYDLLPRNLSLSENLSALNNKGELILELERVEKKLHLISFRLQEASMLQFTISGFLQNTKVYLTDATGQVNIPRSDESDKGARALRWELPSDSSFTLAVQSEPEFYCDALKVRLVLSTTNSTQHCHGHGQTRVGECVCEAGYTGLTCEVCESDYEPQSSGVCTRSLRSSQFASAEGTSWQTAVLKVVLCISALSVLYYLYSNKQQNHVNRSDSSDSDDEEEEFEGEEEEMALRGRSSNNSK